MYKIWNKSVCSFILLTSWVMWGFGLPLPPRCSTSSELAFSDSSKPIPVGSNDAGTWMDVGDGSTFNPRKCHGNQDAGTETEIQPHFFPLPRLTHWQPIRVRFVTVSFALTRPQTTAFRPQRRVHTAARIYPVTRIGPGP
jgi:hypothetical protein